MDFVKAIWYRDFRVVFNDSLIKSGNVNNLIIFYGHYASIR